MAEFITGDSIVWEMVGRYVWRCMHEDGRVGEYRLLPESDRYEWRYSTDNGNEYEIGFCDDMTEAMLTVESKFRGVTE